MEKKKLFILIAALFFALLPLASISCFANEDEPLPIVIGDPNPGGGPIFYAPAQIPIGAVVYPSLCTIVVDFLFDLGSVSIEIENLTTNSYSQTTLNATQGAHPILFSGDSGIYEITFTLSNGHIYWGTFEIE